MALPVDVVDKVLQDFSKDDSVIVLQLLSEFEQTYPQSYLRGITLPRLLRCIVFVSKGNFEDLADAVKLAQIDWRDLVVAAEYKDWNNQPVRNFNLPFDKQP